MRRKFFALLTTLITRHSGKVLIGCGMLTLAMLAASNRLALKTQFADMLPEDIPLIEEFMEIVDDYGSESTVMITVESPDKDLKQMRRAADDIAVGLQEEVLYKPVEDQPVSFAQKLALIRGEYPVNGLSYDTVSLVKRIDYKVDNDFILRHGMIIQDPEDLPNTINMFSGFSLPEVIENINDNFEKEYIDNSDNLSTLDGEGEAVQGLETIGTFVSSIGTFLDEGDTAKVRTAVNAFVTGPQYFISPDNTMLLLMLQPAMSMNEFDDMMALGYRIDDTLAVAADRYPDLQIGRSGAMMMQIDENNAMAKDFGWPSLVVLLLILVLLIGTFNSWKNPFYSVFTLIVGILWTAGWLALTVRFLNMMSASFGIVLVGLGIDFAIHFISGFKDGREQGMSSEDAIAYMYNRVGSGVITGALTTAIVFFCMPLTRFEAYAQMGFAMGSGIVLTLLAMMILLPALIMWDNKGYSVTGNLLRRLRLGFLIPPLTLPFSIFIKGIALLFRLPLIRLVPQFLQFRFLGGLGTVMSTLPAAVIVLIASVILMIYSIRAGSSMEWEYDMMKLQPAGTPGIVTQNKIIDKFEISPDFAMVKADDVQQCRELVEEFKRVGNKTDLIGRVDAITEFLPPVEEQRENIPLINSFKEKLVDITPPRQLTSEHVRTLAGQLERLHMNIVEIGELSIMGSGANNKIIKKCDQIVGKTDEESAVLALAQRIAAAQHKGALLDRYQHVMGPVLHERIFAMTSTDIVTLDNLPREIKERYVNPNNDDLLINVYPRGYIWEETELKKFNEVTSEVTPRITGMPGIIEVLMEVMGEKGKIAMIYGAIAILIFLLIDFHSFGYMVLAAIPLATGAAWMLGMMAATGMKLSMMNFMALPMIIGIGIDDGVHVLHRYRIEGRGSMPIVLKFTGRAILLTSLTTILGFGSMGLASHRGLAVMGQTLVYGVGACFLSSVLVLPSLITILERIRKPKASQ